MCNFRQLNTDVGVMFGWCLACCAGVVVNTVRESATSDCKENKQADAGNRTFSKAFYVRRVVVIVHRLSVKVYLHMYNGNVQQNPCAASCHNESSHLSPVLAYDFLSRRTFSTPTSAPLYSSINRLYAQNSVFEVVREESVKVYLHMHDENIQQNPIGVESCVPKEFSISPRFSPTMFDPDANSVLLRAHLCTAVDSMRRKPRVQNCFKRA